MHFTEEQKSVIDSRGCNLLVSAAAGSGKTAVLVRRIIELILDEKAPVGADELLVMTFTRAAAAQMKDRLMAALETELIKAMDEGKDSLLAHIENSISLLRTADICTIDGFCTKILREHFSKIGLNPAFRIAEEGELKLIRGQVLEEVLEEAYSGEGEEGEAFIRFVDSFSLNKDDKDIENAIIKLYEFSQGKPFPKEWLSECDKHYNYGSKEAFFQTPFIRAYFDRVVQKAEKCVNIYEDILKVCREADGPDAYLDMIEGELSQLKNIYAVIKEGDYTKSRQALVMLQFGRLKPIKKDSGVNEDKKQYVTGFRDQVKKETAQLLKDFYPNEAERLYEDVAAVKESAGMLKLLTIRFYEAFLKEKEKRKVVDFSDLEHFAIEVLYDRDENGKIHPSKVADEYRNHFKEIMVDEYQDSNLVQEYIIEAISRKDEGNRNVFMVGDVKQSIYRFRLADPHLFMKKRDTYPVENYTSDRRIDLHKNFRSSREVVETVNFIFKRLMIRSVGGVEYDEDAMLRCGAEYPDGVSDKTSELIFAEPLQDYSKEETEAIFIAQKIRELMDNYRVSEDGGRPLRYSDIAVLVRATKGYETAFGRIFAEYGIPLVTESKTGYFNSYEIIHLLNYLGAVSNAREDELLAAVLKGPFGNFNDEELAVIRLYDDEIFFWEAVYELSAEGNVSADNNFLTDSSVEGKYSKWLSGFGSVELKDKVSAFILRLENYKEKASYMTVKELIAEIIKDTSYELLVGSMDRRDMRLMNLSMLKEKAAAFENTSYKGLFHFIRYIKQLKKYEVDFGLSQDDIGGDGAVSFMTIHKSKGLEFPVCFLSGCSKQFNEMDSREKIITDSDEGIGMDFIDGELRVKAPTILKKAMISNLKSENRGEELRVLYVALTRAKEKLIMTGVYSRDDFEKDIPKKWRQYISPRQWELMPDDILDSKNFLELLVKAVMPSACMGEVLSELSQEMDKGNCLYTEKLPLKISFSGEIEAVLNEEAKTVDLGVLEEGYRRFIAGNRFESSYDFSWKYPQSTTLKIPEKLSVTELKKKHESDDYIIKAIAPEKEDSGETAKDVSEGVKAEAPVPDFISGNKKEELIGSLRGTAYHRMFEIVDYNRGFTETEIKAQIEENRENGKFETSQADCINPKDFVEFGKTKLAGKMGEAFKNGLLRREQPFMIEVPAESVNEDYPEGESIIIQGIIDAMFYTEGGCVIVDYKTDRVKKAEELSERYRVQLDYYARAVEQLTGKKVVAKVIYSVALGREIYL